ncbi:MBL fold metallo-hydrolase [Oceanobacillus piezotolerans]|uniref:MBL fold metallo-hydrolase n=1 Tax=Oceanobacillus piezotolerans TaxID=2448030 RepID=A0A498DB07_9BACI|nr:MBL fold metallo-hydrolase [Oceanobacillus piezotolerans]RLL46874.1 MBL fold metallo-hydrolase [Oceanobacillus piezotolerans]
MIDIFKHEGVTCVKAAVSKDGVSVYIYLVDGMLIDTGPQILEKELITFYNQYEFDLVTLTHSHEDHTGTASWIEHNKNVPIYIHPKGIPKCEENGNYPEYRQIAWGIRRAFHPQPLGEKIHSKNLKWEVIYTPGHADDHVALLDKENGRLFSGDMYVLPTVKVIMSSESIPQIIHSINKLLSLEFKIMYCSHAGYLLNGRKALEEKLENLLDIYATVSDLYEKGYSNSEIDQTLFRKRYKIEELSNGEYGSANIVNSIVSDLQRYN